MTAIIALALTGILNLFLGFWCSRKTIQVATMAFILLAFGLNVMDWNHEYLWFGNQFHSTNTSINFGSIILLAGFFVTAFSEGFGKDEIYTQPAEYYALLLFSLVGALLMVAFDNLIMLFVGLEILSVAMYVLTGSDKRNLRSNEAAIKYFLMGSFATGILLFGFALIYGAGHSFYLKGIQEALANTPKESMPSFVFAGIALVMVGLLFKIAAAPFHFWSADVYQGAPTIFTMFMSTVVKTAGFAALYLLLIPTFGSMSKTWSIPLYFVSILSMLVGNITAVYQSNMKRLLAYSSISHAGFVLLTLCANQAETLSSVLYYTSVYSIASLSSFAVVKIVSEHQSGRVEHPENVEAFFGLAKHNPLLAFAFTISLLSLAGIPLTAGFWAKFFVFSDVFNKNLLYPVVIAILMSAVGVYYYFKGIVAAYFKEGQLEHIALGWASKLSLILLTLASLALGLYPDLIKPLF